MKKILILIVLVYFLLSFDIFARENVFDWYIKDFQTEIEVNKDSSLLITEKIIADCGDAVGKHGIFRVLPTKIITDEGIIKTPIELISISDFNGNPLKYKTIKDYSNHTITWKIGDPDKTVRGVNYYKIVYRIKNAISFQNPEFDEFYWNLNGNFWDLEIDNFTAKIIFPIEVNQNNTQIDYYTGLLGSKSKDLATYQWLNSNTLQFISTRTLLKEEGITVSVTFPKGIFFPYQATFFEKYSWFLIPTIVFIFLFIFWWKKGKDLILKKTVIAEYQPPENLKPAEIGFILKQKVGKNEIAATIIDLAIRKYLQIKEIQKKNFFEKDDYEIVKINDFENDNNLSLWEKDFLRKNFSTNESVKLSEIGIGFEEFFNVMCKELTAKGYFVFNPNKIRKIFSYIGFFIIFFPLIFVISYKIETPPTTIFAFIISGLLFIIFSFFMPKKTQKGAEALWKVKGFKLYMETAEKYRQQFYEKENIFEKFLPYAIVFGITNLWIKKMKEIYSEEYFKNYIPSWYIGLNVGSFNIDTFSSNLNNISSKILMARGTSSGARGFGRAGGGRGGGGGGGW